MQYVSYSWVHDAVFYCQDSLIVATVLRDRVRKPSRPLMQHTTGFRRVHIVTGRTLIAVHPWMLLIL